ncbi:hypothetical protein BFW38_09975 [Terasakiispira papahanaumokuakeensis]|uniref:Uncharacterized protein n=1 Tax=Terasakiispira papahanaumokuakeensis TaxID=197479 RepID=A0A1E2VA06_9GAMM|nr:hypothetical protein [Terasakiispira papahanaumokuakeensis]ODC03821.1 hypothetical protein BFW38_09975 [Terasakiispira papahanaumokuakeensis]
MALTPQARKRRARQLVGLTLLAELQTGQRNLLTLMLDKATIWSEDRQALRLPPKTEFRDASRSTRKEKRALRLRHAVFRLAERPIPQPRQLVYQKDTYRPVGRRPQDDPESPS